MSKQIIITLYKSELLYDVQNRTHLAARSREQAQDVAATANMQVNDAAPENNQVMRSLGSAFDRLLTKLSPYYCRIPEQKQEPEPCPHARACAPGRPDEVYAADNVLTGSGRNTEFTVPLTMPDNFNEAFTGAATASLHGYMVNTAIAEWFTLTSPQDAAAWYELAEREIEKARIDLHARIRPVKRNLSVF